MCSLILDSSNLNAGSTKMGSCATTYNVTRLALVEGTFISTHPSSTVYRSRAILLQQLLSTFAKSVSGNAFSQPFDIHCARVSSLVVPNRGASRRGDRYDAGYRPRRGSHGAIRSRLRASHKRGAVERDDVDVSCMCVSFIHVLSC